MVSLGRCIFEKDLRQFSQLLRTEDVAAKDKHGNTPLHLSVMLGRKEFTHLLLAHQAPVKVKNLQGWSPLSEAISYGDRQIITLLVRKLKQQTRQRMEKRRPDLVQALKQIDDFYMELKWDFHSWVPLVSRILPSDICKIYKSGCLIRFDTTLVDFSDMKWERGDISFLFRGDRSPKESLTVLDREFQCYQRVRYEETDGEIEDEVDILMSNDIMAAQMSTKGIHFSRAQSGWIFREDKRELVAGQFDCQLYSIHGLQLESRKRREHLSRDDLQKNKALMESLIKGGSGGGGGSHGPTAPAAPPGGPEEAPFRRDSLAPPPSSQCTWEEYMAAEPGKHPQLGRNVVYKESAKAFKATLAMSKDFPLTVQTLLDVLEVVAPFKHFAKLREFITMRLPDGFPVKIDIPILPTITATVTFQRFELRERFAEGMFDIPAHFLEDSLRFPDL